MGFLDEIKSLFNTKEAGNSKNNNLIRNIVIIGMIGTLLLLFANVFVDTNDNRQEIPASFYQDNTNKIDEVNYETKISNQLEEIIGLIKGVGNVKVNVYVTRYAEYEYEYNSNLINKITSEADHNGGEREIVEDNIEKELVITKDSAGNERPVIRKETRPVIEGILIVAQGAEKSQIKYEIIKSISSLLNIPIHKINVLPYERR